MYSRTGRGGECSQIDDEVPNLTEEVVLVGIPVVAVIVIHVGIDDCDTLKRWCCLQHWQSDSITNKLRVIVLDDRPADDIGARRKVDESGNDSRRIASLPASVARGYSVIDRNSVVGRTITEKNQSATTSIPNPRDSAVLTDPLAPKSFTFRKIW